MSATRESAARIVQDPLPTDHLVGLVVPDVQEMDPADQARLRELAAGLRSRGLAEAFIASSLRSTAAVLRDLRTEENSGGIFQREEVRRFIAENAAPQRAVPPIRRERRREERERLQSNVVRLLREARLARGRHEVKKTRSMLLKLDQRELRRVLGSEGDDLCRQINTWLRSTAAMF